uniref:Uncharacterized protein n=1 Tax=candidate division WWE3 bacterium TaxID=2053526 RepID=A0A831Z0P3_UNCKA
MEQEIILPPGSSYETKKLGSSRFPWRKVGRGILFLVLSVGAFSLGYFGVWAWQSYFPPRLGDSEPPADWQVFKSEPYLLGFRYPADWEAQTVSASFVVLRPRALEGVTLPKDYISFFIAPTGSRAQTPCENDQAACSFYANGIFGDRFSSPEEETIFFAQAGNDFTLKWHRYGEADFTEVFNEISASFRFTTPEKTDAQTP